MHRTSRLTAAAAAVALGIALVACGDSSGPSVDNNGVALFENGKYVDYRPQDNTSEAWNLDSAFVSFDGLNIKRFRGIGETAFKLATKNRRYLVIPELEQGDLFAALTVPAQDAIKSFVSGGGILVVFGEAENELVLVNGLWGYSIAVGSNGAEPWAKVPASVSGTPFAALPDTLRYGNGTATYDISTLPAGAKVIYSNSDLNEASVFYIPKGNGAIVIVGRDYYDAAPFGSLDGGWMALLEAAVNFHP